MRHMELIKLTWISILLYGGATFLLVLLLSFGKDLISNNMRQNFAKKYSIFRRLTAGRGGIHYPHPHLHARSSNGIFFKSNSFVHEQIYPRNVTILRNLNLSAFNHKFVSRNDIGVYDYSLLHNPKSFCTTMQRFNPLPDTSAPNLPGPSERSLCPLINPEKSSHQFGLPDSRLLPSRSPIPSARSHLLEPVDAANHSSSPPIRPSIHRAFPPSPSELFLLIIVCSSTNNSAIRQVIRETWAKPAAMKHATIIDQNLSDLEDDRLQSPRRTTHVLDRSRSPGRNHSSLDGSVSNSSIYDVYPSTPFDLGSPSSPLPNVRIVFLLGAPKSSALQHAIDAESRLRGDVLQFDFIDTYDNLTLKTIMGIKWAARFCSSARYVLKVDDDVLLNVDLLVAQLKRRNFKRSIMGHVFVKGSYVMRDRKSKWFVPASVYPHFKFPPYVDGPAYVLSGDLIHTIAHRADFFPFLFLEDVFSTGMLTMEQNVSLISNDRFKLNPSLPVSLCNYLSNIALHNVDYLQKAMIKRLWSSFDRWRNLPKYSKKLNCRTPSKNTKRKSKPNLVGVFSFLL